MARTKRHSRRNGKERKGTTLTEYEGRPYGAPALEGSGREGEDRAAGAGRSVAGDGRTAAG